MIQEFQQLQFVKTSFFIFLFLCSFTTKAQDCATPNVNIQEAANLPWFGNPDYLPSFMDSVRSVDGIPSQYSRVVPHIKWRIPIRFWIFTTGNNSDPANLLKDGEDDDLPQELELQRLVDDANDAFRSTEVPSGIQFYMKGSRQVVFQNTSPSAARILLFLSGSGNSAYYDDKAINVYITTGGDTYFSGLAKEFIVLERNRYASRNSATSMAHELGHYLGLFHTHQFTAGNTWCLREPVTRGATGDPACLVFPVNLLFLPIVKRCSYTGDFLCDTEADPKLTDNINTATCTYTGNKKDYWGERFHPLGDNYMAYGNRSCRKTFTETQVGVMWSTLLHTPRGRSGRWRIDLNGRQVDIYEPNNTVSGALSTNRRGLEQEHLLHLNIPQLHTFHKNIYNEVIDNTDWIPIETPPNGVIDDYVITVESTIANFIEDIEVFNAGEDRGLSVETQLLTRIVSSAVPNQTKWQISIPCDIVNAERLYLRVRRNQALNQFGTYTVLATSPVPRFGDDFPRTICPNQSNVVSLFSVPANTSVSWSYSILFDNGSSLPLFPLLSRGAPTVSFVTPFSSGVYTLQAVVTSNRTGCSVTVEREMRIGKVPLAAINVETAGLNAQNETCPNSSFKIRARLDEANFPLVTADRQEWISTNPAFVIDAPDAFGFRQVRAPNLPHQSTTLIYRVTNACGTTETRTIVHTVVQMNGRIIDCDGFNGKVELNAYPNPAESDITAIFKVDCQECKKEELESLYPQLDENTIVTLSDGFGNIRLHYEGKQIPLDINGNIYLHLAKLPVGNYVLKVITKEEVFFTHVIKE